MDQTKIYNIVRITLSDNVENIVVDVIGQFFSHIEAWDKLISDIKSETNIEPVIISKHRVHVIKRSPGYLYGSKSCAIIYEIVESEDFYSE